MLEQARFGERLRVSLRVAPEVLPIAVPFLVVQPLVENAVRHGLEGLTTLKNEGLRALFKVAGMGEGSAPSASQVSFQLAPRINAAGRMSTAKAVIELLLTADPERARAMALSDSSRQIGAAIVRHHNFTSDGMFAASLPSFLNATCQRILLVEAGNDY